MVPTLPPAESPVDPVAAPSAPAAPVATPAAATPASAATPAAPRTTRPVPANPRWPWQIPWVHTLLVVCLFLLLVAGGIEAFRRIQRYNRDALEAKLDQPGRPAELTIEFVPRPNWMDPELVRILHNEVQQFANLTVSAKRADQPAIYNYSRLRNPLLDGDVRATDRARPDVLRELQDYYVAHRAERSNAWIKSISAIRRSYDPKRNEVCISIAAEFRRPVAVMAQGNSYYLVDEEGVRLPGEYTERERPGLVGKVLPGTNNTLLMIRGVDEAVPEAGKAFTSADALAGLRLVHFLAEQAYAEQIAAVNLANFGGRMDKLAPQITLDTTFQTSVWWGRPAEEERFYEVALGAKLKALSNLFQQHGRIDAGRDYVDIRFDAVRVPIMATSSPTDPRQLPIPPRRRPT